MKTIIYFLFTSLLIGLSFSQSKAQNTVYGIGAGSGGYSNAHIGAYAGRISTGNWNTFLGFGSGYNNTTGNNNTFLGFGSGDKNTTGVDNTFIGSYSGSRNVTGSYNTFIGVSSGAVSKGNYNTFMGYNSGRNNTGGTNNTFLGNKSGYFNSTGSNNTFLGYHSGYSNTTGYNNIFLGNSSGYNNYTGHTNNFLGNSSGFNNYTGYYNTFLGHSSGYKNTTGAHNTFLGFYSGYNNATGEKNGFIGYLAGYSETGSNKLYIDYSNDDNPLLYGNFASNVLSIGTKYTGTEYKLVIPGNVRATKYDVVSDERLKENVKSLNNVLAKVQQVKGVSYVLKDHAVNGKAASSRQKADKAVQYGFLAQNIREIFPELVTEDEGLLAVNYQGMIPVLVEALKSLSAQKDSVVAMNLTMVQQLMAMQQRLDALETAVGQQKQNSSGNAADYRLEQNHPNPFNQNTTIRYQVSKEAQQVRLVITNQQGVEVQRFERLPAGAGEVQVTAGSLAPGKYVYTLFADGRLINSKQMMLTR